MPPRHHLAEITPARLDERRAHLDPSGTGPARRADEDPPGLEVLKVQHSSVFEGM
jgi:hypothetical protein